jgi:hypothetical protein
MLSRRLRLYLTAALTLSLGTAACDRPSSVTDPVVDSAVSPQFSRGGSGKYQMRKVNVTVSETDEAEAVIDNRGGIIALYRGGAVLVIPQGAVRKPTTFRLKLEVGPGVKLIATATSKGGKLDDVGEAGFKKDLTLYLSKFGAKARPGSPLVISEIDGDELIPLQTRDLGIYVSATIKHFTMYWLSDYSMAE